jgi:putative nucleotidyltransferase with HDIG domain
MSAEPPSPAKSTFDESTFETDMPPLGREPWAAHWAGRIGRHQVALAILTVLALWAIITFPIWQGRQYHVGEVVDSDIIAPHSLLLINEEITNAKRHEAAALVPPVYEGQPEAGQQALNELNYLAVAAQTPLQTAAQLAQKWANLTSAPPLQLQPLAITLLSLPQPDREQIFKTASQAVRNIYQEDQIRSDVPEDLHIARRHILLALEQTSPPLNTGEKHLAAALAMLVAKRPNLVSNPQLTERARRHAEEDVHSVYEQIQAGDVVVPAGTLLGASDLSRLQALGLISSTPNVLTITVKLVLCIILVLLCGAFLVVVHRPLLQEPTWLWLTAVIPLAVLVLFRFALRVPHGEWMLAPLAAVAAMVPALLFDVRPGLLTGFLVAICGALLADASAGLFFAAVLAAWIGALAMANITSRGQLVRAALLLAATEALLIVLFGYLQHLPTEQFFALLAWGAFSGIGAAFVAIALAMLLERPFGITTHLRLLDLISPQEGILLRMQTEAPGTYTHSLMVSMLSENAAKEVNADSLLCRIAGLYHDIGKLRRPHFFIENQTGENIHDRIAPQLSAQIILAHVRDGVVLGKALRLPTPVLDIIAQHHGTSLVAFFYHRAMTGLDVNTREAAQESQFRYPGPQPQSKEAALVMLADTVEASSRALKELTLESLRGHVQEVISTRLREGELSQCDLTLRDLRKIEDSFITVLRGALHHRIEYPEQKNGINHANDKQWVREALAEGFKEQREDAASQNHRHVRQERKLNRKRRQEHQQEQVAKDHEHEKVSTTP